MELQSLPIFVHAAGDILKTTAFQVVMTVSTMSHYIAPGFLGSLSKYAWSEDAECEYAIIRMKGETLPLYKNIVTSNM